MKGRRPVSADELVAHAAFVRRVARRLVGTAADADDVAQDALLALWQRGAPQTGRRAWLTAIVRNLARLSWRRDARRRQRERAAARHEAGSMPDVVLARAEWHRRLAGEVAHLPEPECTAIVLRYYDGLSAAEAARRLGVTPTTIRNRCRRALSRMRAKLGERHGSAWMPALLALAAMPKRATAATIGGTSIMTTKVAIPAAIAACILTGGSTLLLLDDDETGQAAHAGVTSKRPARPVMQESGEPAPPKRTDEDGGEVTKESLARAAARYLRRVRDAADINEVTAIGLEIARLDPQRGWAILSTIYKDIAEARTRRFLVSGFLNLLDSKGRPPDLVLTS